MTELDLRPDADDLPEDGHWATDWREDVIEDLVRRRMPGVHLWFAADGEHVFVVEADDAVPLIRYRMGTTARAFLLGEHDDTDALEIALLSPRREDD